MLQEFRLQALLGVLMCCFSSFAVVAAPSEKDTAEESLQEAQESAEQAAAEAMATLREIREERRRVERSASASDISPRLTHRFGAYVSAWGDPYPTTLGFNAAYHVSDFARVNIGIGSDDPDHYVVGMAGVGVKAMVPGWQLTPIVGVNLTFARHEDTTDRRAIRGFSPSDTQTSVNFGFDVVLNMGLNLGMGYVLPIPSNKISQGNYYLNAGLFL